MTDNIIVPIINKDTIKDKIYEIRGERVMLDSELAELYGYTTKRFNEQVKNNIDKFPLRYRFQLTKQDVIEISRSKNLTTIMQTIGTKGGRVYLPYAFTEQGIYMLMTVLKGDLATKQSIALIDAFKQMKDYVLSTNILLPNCETIKLIDLVNKNTSRIEKIENQLSIVMENFIDPSTYNHFLFLNGQRLEADVAYQDLYGKAKKSVYIIDDYIDVKTLQLLKSCSPNVEIIILTENKSKNNLNSNFINDFKKDTGYNISIKHNGNCFHDRYVILDYGTKNEKIYLCGCSSKDAGNRIATINEIRDVDVYKQIIEELLQNKDFIF